MTRLTQSRLRRGGGVRSASSGAFATAGNDAPEESSRSEVPGSQPGSVSSAANVIAWVYRLIVKTDLEMEVRPGAEPGAAFKADPLALRHRHAIPNREPRHMPVEAG